MVNLVKQMPVHFTVELSVQCMQTSHVGGLPENVLRKTAVCADEEAELGGGGGGGSC